MKVARKSLAVLLLVAIALFAANVLSVLIGGGVSFEVAGVSIRSILLEFPLIATAGCGLLYVLVIGKWPEAILVVLSLCVGMVVAEVGLRVTDHPLSKAHIDYARWYRASEYFGHELIPGFEGFGPLNVPVKINSQGFRDGEHEKAKPSGTLRVLGLGDSFTFGWGVSQDETFLKQLERQLRIEIGRPVEVINAGVPGWGLCQYDLYLRREDLDYSPDIIVIAYFVDDLPPPKTPGVCGEPLDSIVQRQEVPPVKGGILRHFRLYNFMKFAANWVREKNKRERIAYLHSFDERRKAWSERVNYLMTKPDDQTDIEFKGHLRDYLLKLRHAASEKQSHLVLMFIPDIAQLNHHEAQYINGVLRKMTRELGVSFVDMTPTFEVSKDPATYYLWPKDPHTNARGHLEMAEALLKVICKPSDLGTSSCRQDKFRSRESVN